MPGHEPARGWSAYAVRRRQPAGGVRPLELDLVLRFRVQALMKAIDWRCGLPGHRRPHAGHPLAAGALRSAPLTRRPMLARCVRLPTCDLRGGRRCEVPSRIVHLPLSWDDPATRLAIERYMTTVRKDAPWCPSNIEFIRRINGLDSRSRCAHRLRCAATW
jgi:urea carboxylase